MMSIPTPPVAKPSANQLLVGRAAQLGGGEVGEARRLQLGSGSQDLRPTSVWVIARDNHCEGLSEPFAAYRTKAAAEDAMELLSNADGTYRLVEVPFRGL